ncbi:MAG: metallophosphoesterase [Tepidisphaeraceae bacterium]
MYRTSRRALLRSSSFALLASSLWPGRLFAQQANAKTLQFVIVNDLHYIDDACGAYFAKLAAHIKALPDVTLVGVFLAGDLADHGKAEEYAGLKSALAGIGLPLWAVPGNHDFVSTTSCEHYDAVFPRSHNRVMQQEGYQILLLDTTQNTQWKGTKIAADTLAFVEDRSLEKGKPTILITHFPFNPKVESTPTNAEALLDRLKEHNLIGVFGGHYHGYTTCDRGAYSCVTNRCCSLKRNNHDGTKEKGYFVCTAAEGKVTAKFVEFTG